MLREPRGGDKISQNRESRLTQLAATEAESNCVPVELDSYPLPSTADAHRTGFVMPKTDATVDELVTWVEKGQLRLPELQRQYVWTATRVRDLFDSLYRGYPSGSILVWQSEGGSSSRDLAVPQASFSLGAHQLLLDGQQRLTSLSAVLRGEPVVAKNRKRPIEIAFNLNHPEGPPIDVSEIDDDSATLNDADDEGAVLEGGDEDDALTIQERLRLRTFVVASRSILADPSWILVSEVMKGGQSDWDLLKGRVGTPDNPRYALYSQRLQRLRDIRRYSYVVQVLPGSLPYEEVAEIFVRVNSLGVKLRSTDLALAIMTAKWPNSLAQLEGFLEECEERWFTLEIGLLVRCIVVFATRQSRLKNVGAIRREQLETAWRHTQEGLRYAINFLRRNAGIEDETLLSSPLFMIPLAVHSVLHEHRLTPEAESDWLHWLYAGSARGHYSNSIETVLDGDLSQIFAGRPPSALLAALQTKYTRLAIEPTDIAGRGIRSPLFSLAYLALKSRGAKDWFSGLGLSLSRQGKQHFIQYHHIFPKSLLRDAGYDKGEINEIANLAFIGGQTNRRISNAEPAKYFVEVIERSGRQTLIDQCVPQDEELWQLSNYRRFLAARRQLLTDAINGFIGTTCQRSEGSEP